MFADDVHRRPLTQRIKLTWRLKGHFNDTQRSSLYSLSSERSDLSISFHILSLSKTLICSFSIKQPQRSPYIPSSYVICARWLITGSHLFIVSCKRLLSANCYRPACVSRLVFTWFTQSSITGVVTTFKTHLNVQHCVRRRGGDAAWSRHTDLLHVSVDVVSFAWQ